MEASANSSPLRAVLGAIKMAGLRCILDWGARKPFRNELVQQRFFFRAQQPAVDPAPHRIQQRQPILRRGVFDLLPLLKAFFALVENPLPAHMLGITLQRLAFRRGALPTDFGFWHYVSSGKSTLAT